MSSTKVASQIQKQNAELSDLNRRYREKRDELITRNERNLSDIKKKYDTKTRETRESGQASVNHIKNSTAQEVAQAKKNARSKITYERNIAQQKLTNTRADNRRRLEIMRENLNSQKEENKRQIESEQSRKRKTLEKEQQSTRELVKNEAQRRNKASKIAQDELAVLRKKTQSNRAKILGANRAQLNEIQQKHRQKLQETQTRQMGEYEKLRQEGLQERKDQELQNQGLLSQERLQHNSRIENIRNEQHSQITRQKAEHERNFAENVKRNQKEVEAEIQRGTEQKEMIRRGYDIEIKRTHQTGEKAVMDEKKKYEDQLLKQQDLYDNEFKEQQLKHQKQLQTDLDVHTMVKKDRESAFQAELSSQESEFQNTFYTNDKLNRDTLAHQKSLLVNSLDSQKREVMKSFGKYVDKNNDPFYRLKDFETRLLEDAEKYVLIAKVPKHEQKNINVLVKDDRLVINGQREFQDQVNKDGHKITTSKFQSFREEIPIKNPVFTNNIQKQFDKDIMQVEIRKVPIDEKWKES